MQVYGADAPAQPLAQYVKGSAAHLAVTPAGEAVCADALAAMLVLRPQLAARFARYSKAGLS
jgi:hypothetical protein